MSFRQDALLRKESMFTHQIKSLFAFAPQKPSLSFTLAIVRGLEPHLNEIEKKWMEQERINAYQFCYFLAPCLKQKKSRESLELEIPQSATERVQNMWERKMFSVHSFLNSSRGNTVETMDNEDHLQYCLYGLFVGITSVKKSPLMSFLDFRAFILQITIGGKSGIDENEVKPITLTREFACRALYHVSKMELFEELNVIVAAIERANDGPAAIRVLELPSMKVTDEFKFKISQGNVACFEVVTVATALSSAKVRLLLVGTLDGFVHALDAHRLRVCRAVVSFDHPQSAAKFIKKLGLILLGSTKGVLTGISLAGMEQYPMNIQPATSFHILRVATLHSEAITAIDTGYLCETIFTASLDRTICQIQSKDFAILRRMEGHKAGILSMCYNQSYNTVVSSGVEYEVYCWTLERHDVSEPSIMRDASRPTTVSIPQLRTVASKPLVVSLDVRGNIKVWDLRTLRCICSVDCEPEMTRAELDNLTWTSFAIDPRRIDVVTAANRKCYVFEYDIDDRALGPYCAHEGPIVGAVFDMRSKTMISAAKTELQTWHLETAKPLNRIRGVASESITFIWMIPELSAFLIATKRGVMQLYSTASFATLEVYLHCSHQAVISMCSLPDAIGVCAVGAPGGTEVIYIDSKTWNMHGVTLMRGPLQISGSCCATLSTLRYLLVGETNNATSIWSFVDTDISRTSPPIEVTRACSFPADREIVCLATVEHLPCYVASDGGGWLQMWAANEKSTWILSRWPNRRPPELRTPPRAQCLVICSPLMVLFSGDDFGNINVWDLTYGLGRTNLQKVARKLTMKDVPSVHSWRFGPAPPCITFWEAHSEAAVTVLQLMPHPWILLSGGSDCRMQLWTLGGIQIAFLLMRKIGVPVVEQQTGVLIDVDDQEKHNDLPPPYGKAQGDRELIFTWAQLNPNPNEMSFDSALSFSLNPQPRAARRSLKPIEHKLQKVVMRQPTVEERPTCIAFSPTDVVYGVPQYIALDLLGDESARPRACNYVPGYSVHHALYGSSDQFLRLSRIAASKALVAYKSVLGASPKCGKTKDREIQQDPRQRRCISVPPTKEIHEGRDLLPALLHVPLAPSDFPPEAQAPSKWVRNKAGSTTPKSTGKQIAQATGSLIQQSLAMSHPPLTPGGSSVGSFGTCTIASCPILELPESMVVPPVRSLVGNATHPKSHKAKPF